MRSTRIGIITVAIALIAGLVQASTVGAASPRVPEIAGVTVFRADEPGSMLVRLPSGLGEPGSWDLRARFRGTGRVMAFVFVKEGWDGPELRRPMLVGQQFGDCTEEACRPHPWNAGGGVSGQGTMPTREIPEGLYRLYVVTDGAPVVMKLIAPSLDGRITLSPSEPAEVEIQTVDPLAGAMTDANVFAAGARAPFEGPGYSSLRAWWRSDLKPAGMFGLCTYDDDPPPEEVAYLPGVCRNTYVSEPALYPSLIRDGYGTLEASWRYLPAAFGVWHVSGAPQNDIGAVAFWLKTP